MSIKSQNYTFSDMPGGTVQPNEVWLLVVRRLWLKSKLLQPHLYEIKLTAH